MKTFLKLSATLLIVFSLQSCQSSGSPSTTNLNSESEDQQTSDDKETVTDNSTNPSENNPASTEDLNDIILNNIADCPNVGNGADADFYPKTFSQAKVEATKIYQSRPIAFYSGCSYYNVGKKLVPLKESCGYVTRKNENRASRIEWEHVVSMWQVGHQLQCWQNGGRNNCRKVSEKFRQMEADLHNLVPSIGELNADRSNFLHGIIAGEKRVYGAVDAEVDFKKAVFEPRPAVRGDIARIYLYMQQKYGICLSVQQQQLFNQWNNNDPKDSWEIERNLAIAATQGDSSTEISDDNDHSTTLSCNPAKKYCKHMTSCSDAKYYLNNCGRTGLDGDKDGIPCESLCK